MADSTNQFEGRLELGLADLDGLRWAVADVTGPLEEARHRLDLSPIAAVAFGRVMTSATLLLRFTFKNVGRLTVEVAGDGPLGRVSVEVDDRGRIRGLLDNPSVETPGDGSLAIGWAVGNGLFRVTRDRDGERYSSQTELVSGEVGDDLAHYLEQSDQIRSAALVGVLPRAAGIASAGGLLVEALPGTEDAVLTRLETNITQLPGVGALLAAGGPRALADAALDGFPHRPAESHVLRYQCRCNPETLFTRLREISQNDLDGLTGDDGRCVAVCAYCGEQYAFAREALAATN